MGLIHRGLPTELIRSMAAEYQLDTFIETGTFKGDSLAEARSIFPKCYSIEIAEPYYLKAKERFSDVQGIHLLLGNSADKLREIDFSNVTSALFWLDAHYSGGPTGGKDDCPLLREVEYIATLPIDKYIFIDDARYVLHPFQGERYCQIEELFAVLPPENYNVIINDIIMSVPEKARDTIDTYCLQHTDSSGRKIKSKRMRAIIKNIVGEL